MLTLNLQTTAFKFDFDNADSDRSPRIEIDSEVYPEFAKFAAKYRCSEQVEAQAKEEKKKDRYNSQFIIKTPFFYAGPLQRLINARRLQNYTTAQGLNHFSVPEKCFTGDLSGEIIARRVHDIETNNNDFDLGKTRKMSLEEIQQFAQLTEETGFTDWIRDLCRGNHRWGNNDNIYQTAEGKFCFTDTENRSFHKEDLFNRIDLLHKYLRESMTPEAAQWLKQRLAELANTSKGAETPTTLPRNSNFDDPGINFAQAEKEYEQCKMDYWKEYDKAKNQWRETHKQAEEKKQTQPDK